MNRRRFIVTGGSILGLLAAGAGGSAYLLKKLNRLSCPDSASGDPVNGSGYPGSISRDPAAIHAPNSLFRHYPELARKIPWMDLGKFPTPIEKMPPIAGIRENTLWIKRDDLTSPLHGGNKVRKLEHLLADARLKNKRSLITVGGLGSNHALATAIYGQRFGFRVHLCLFDQFLNNYVRNNLAGFLAAGAVVHYCKSLTGAYAFSRKLYKKLSEQGEAPYFILSGGTCGLSNVGHVNAAMELADQVREGLLPEPDRLYVAVGTCGTIAGLIAGLKIAGLSTRVTGVRVVDSFPAYPYIIRYYAQKVADGLRKQSDSVPRIRIVKSDFELLTGYLGEGYAYPTCESQETVRLLSPHLQLETTYTGKALTACLEDGKNASPDEHILFWNSYNSAPFKKAPSLDSLPPEILQKIGL